MDLKANLIKTSEKEGENQIQDLGKKIQSTSIVAIIIREAVQKGLQISHS